MATPQTPRARRSPLARYAPLIAVVVVVAIIAVIVGVASGGKKKKETLSTTTPTGKSAFSDVPILYSEAKAKGTVGNYTWPNCNTTTGEVSIPILNPPPCVPALAAGTSNGGATSPGVTADTIKIGYYIAPPDPLGDALLKQSGAYDPPAKSEQAYKDYAQIYANQYQLYGRKIQLVKIQGTGNLMDEAAAKADADKAADAGVFAVMGGPAQAQNFEAELARRKVLCIAGCVTSAPESTLTRYAPYLWGTGPTPEQSADMTTEFIKSQLIGKDAVYAGDPALRSKPRKFALLSYDTPTGVYKASWDQFYKDLQAAGAPVAGHVSYFLNLSSLQTDARTIANKLKATGATTIVFTGDPIFPNYLTHTMAEQNYFPEWVMAGTVLADTNVFGRSFEQKEWSHAFGLQLIPARLPKAQQDSYTLHQWFFGTKPPTDNNYAIIKGAVELLMNGLQLAGPHLTPQTFEDGLFHAPPQVTGPGAIGTVVSFGSHGYWKGTDLGGLDNAGVLYWDPNAVGPDETGNVGKGMYRLVDGGRRYLPGHWPTTPIPLFDSKNTVTIYSADQIPAELLPTQVPVPANAPAAKK